MKFLCLILLFFLSSCLETTSQSVSENVTASCKGVYYSRTSTGELKKYNEYYNVSSNKCLTDNLELSQWEKSSELWTKNNVTCTPQPQFSSRSLVSDNNFYTYRNNKVFLDLDSSSGIYRRIIIGENLNSSPAFTRLQGCFFQRTGTGVDAVYGNQILLDTIPGRKKSSESFDPWEIFRYTETPTSLETVRFDASEDWNFSFCPESSTPWGFCDLLRNGNIVYYPSLTAQQQSELLSEALLIRRQFNYRVIAKSEFEQMWTSIEKTSTESGRNNWKYMTVGLVDTPRYIDQAWYEYLKGQRPFMPDAGSSQIPPLCYEGTRTIALSDGSTSEIQGEVCYQDGAYEFR